MVIISYSRSTQSKISIGERCMGWRPEETRHKFPRVFSQWSHMRHVYNSHSSDLWQHMKCCLLGKLIRDPVSRVFIGGCHLGTLLPCTCPNSRLPEGKQLFVINHIVFSVYAKGALFSILRMVEILPKSKFPDASQGLTLQEGLSEDSRPQSGYICYFSHIVSH